MGQVCFYLLLKSYLEGSSYGLAYEMVVDSLRTDAYSWALFATTLVVHRLLEGPVMPSLYSVDLLLCTVVTLTVHLHL